MYNYPRKKQKIWKWYVYILLCNDNTYYTGMTWNAEIRFAQHLSGYGGKYTAEHGVQKLVYLEEHEDFELAQLREKQIKGWSQKKKENILINKFKPWW